MISEAQITLYRQNRAAGLSQEKSSRAAGFSTWTAKQLDKKFDAGHSDNGQAWRTARIQKDLQDPIAERDQSPEAKHAREDFAFFQKYCLGRVAVPWQIEAAEKIVELLATDQKEFCVINAPPGVGKSTTFTHDIPAWLTCRNRAIRGLVGSVTGKLATQYTRRLRRSFENVVPVKAEDWEKKLGIALDAETTLSHLFGRFRPLDNDIWTADSFTVAQPGNIFSENKETTWTAVGRDQEFIGGRFDFCVWDDLVSLKRLRTLELIESDQRWWDSYAERRLEPAGLLILQGQRMGANDLYRYCIEMGAPVEAATETADTAEIIDFEPPKKYHHLKFKAHYEERCTGSHVDVKPYPEGCLLYPERLPWHEIFTYQQDQAQMFATVYQQEDVSASSVLVNPEWISGGGGRFPGCWDNDRDCLEIPANLSAPTFSVVSVDPSPTRYWGIIWWLYNQPSDTWFLIDLERRGLDAPDFLDWSHNMGEFTGLMRDWQEASIKLGVPISHWIVERNGAQRFLYAYDHYKRFQSKYSVEIIPHDTSARNKLDDEYGVQMIAPSFKWGRVRLPGKVSRQPGVGLGRTKSLKLIEEVTRYPQSSTTDLVMSTWFAQYQMQYLAMPSVKTAVQERPHWLRQYRPQVRGRVAV